MNQMNQTLHCASRPVHLVTKTKIFVIFVLFVVKIKKNQCNPCNLLTKNKRSHSADGVIVAKWLGLKNKCKIQKLQCGVQSVIIPHLCAVVFARLPIVIAEVESVGSFDDFLFA